MKKWRVLLLASFIIIAGGCIRKSILDDINILTVIGYDYIDKNSIKGTALIPVYETEKILNETFTTTSIASQDIFEELQHESSDPIAQGSLEMVLYGEELAKKGVIPIIDTLQRDSRIGTRLYLAVVNGTANELLKGKYGTRGNGIYLSNLIRQNIEQRDIPKTNLHKFLYAYYSDGRDPFLPYIQKEKDKVKIVGIALFDGDRMVHYIKESDMFYFKILVDRYTEGTYTIQMADNQYAAVKSIVTDRNFFFSGSKERPNITVDIEFRGILHEYSQRKYNKKIKQKIETTFEKEIVKETSKLIKHLQSHQIDPIGFGEEAKSRYRNFSYKAFYENYPTLDIKINAKVTIIDSGIVD
ncbi:spore germination protein [Anoxybacillus vitaminiphilus]|uniref:Spore germination protein n=1 Tax=Paranoxybacillus vitaminiphilus TaxID=581036 RepID=A0A327YEV5_9BACL|nr:Ger(x)C family spore germination protein [Anoxybacillus vitaminiphilus]RAK18606.1 spore germination protein [Anoxybacillus vitaminiphilus]